MSRDYDILVQNRTSDNDNGVGIERKKAGRKRDSDKMLIRGGSEKIVEILII